MNAFRSFTNASSDFLFVSADGASLDGLVTLTDIELVITGNSPLTTPISALMAAKPVALALDDTALTAANTLREYRLTSIPVIENRVSRRIAGVVRSRRLTAVALQASANANSTVAGSDASR